MKPHPRIRKAIKGGGAAVTVLLVVVWVGSGWWIAYWNPCHGAAVGLEEGCMWASSGEMNSLTLTGPAVPPVLECWHPPSMGFAWRFGPAWFSFGEYRRITFPLWPFAAVMGLVALMAWRLDTLARRRARLNLCPKCGYDRAGLVGGAAGAKCPECGASPAS